MKQRWLNLMHRSGAAPAEQARVLRRRLAGMRGLRHGGGHFAATARKSLAREFRRHAPPLQH